MMEATVSRARSSKSTTPSTSPPAMARSVSIVSNGAGNGNWQRRSSRAAPATWKTNDSMADDTALLEFDREALAALLADLNQPAFRARQIWHWIYQRGVLNPIAMTDLPTVLRHDLAERISTPQDPATVQTSSDRSTTKALIPLSDSELVETVLIRHEPHEHASQRLRRTVCISSQAGCAMGCVFCATGLQGFRRQLTVGEIIQQVLLARDWARAEGEELTHAVFMGMGEPLANYGPVSEALSRLSDPATVQTSSDRSTTKALIALSDS